MHGGRACAWCGDYESQHDEHGCLMCRAGQRPWERGEYKCDRFYATQEEAEGKRRDVIAATEEEA